LTHLNFALLNPVFFRWVIPPFGFVFVDLCWAYTCSQASRSLTISLRALFLCETNTLPPFFSPNHFSLERRALRGAFISPLFIAVPPFPGRHPLPPFLFILYVEKCYPLLLGYLLHFPVSPVPPPPPHPLFLVCAVYAFWTLFLFRCPLFSLCPGRVRSMECDSVPCKSH